MMNLKRWFVFTLTGVALASLLAVAASFALIYKARADAARYLGIVMPIQIGTPYDVVATQLRDAGTPMKLLGDCNHKCRIEFGVNDEWLHRLYIAPAARFFGTLEFKDAKLSSKTTGMASRM